MNAICSRVFVVQGAGFPSCCAVLHSRLLVGYSDGAIRDWRCMDGKLLRTVATPVRVHQDCAAVNAHTDLVLSQLLLVGPLLFASGHDGRLTVTPLASLADTPPDFDSCDGQLMGLHTTYLCCSIASHLLMVVYGLVCRFGIETRSSS